MSEPVWVSCLVHGKRGYYSRRDAERAARMYHPGDHLDSYPCDQGTGLFHIGHLPIAVLKGGARRPNGVRR